jgi:hypothetical protein
MREASWHRSGGVDFLSARHFHSLRRALLIPRSDERDRHCRSPRGWSSAQQSCREFASTVSTAREGHAAVSEHKNPTEIQLNSRPGPQSFQSGAPPRQPCNLQRKTLGLVDGVARSGVVDAAPISSYCVPLRQTIVALTRPRRGRELRRRNFRANEAMQPLFRLDDRGPARPHVFHGRRSIFGAGLDLDQVGLRECICLDFHLSICPMSAWGLLNTHLFKLASSLFDEFLIKCGFGLQECRVHRQKVVWAPTTAGAGVRLRQGRNKFMLNPSEGAAS